jgi:Na+/phosphate symporter
MRRPPPTIAELNALLADHRKARRVVIGHFIFFIICCVLIIIARRYLKFPMQLSWVIIVAFLVAFAGDLGRFLYRRYQLQRLLAAHNS